MKKYLLLLLASLASLVTPAFAQLSTPVPNAGTTGTTVNELAIINSSGQAVIATTSSTTVPSYIVAGNAGTTGSALLGDAGQQFPCVMDSTITGTTAGGYFVTPSTSIAGECHASSTAPTGGTWLVGFLISNSTVASATAQVLAANQFFGSSVTINAAAQYDASYYSSTSGISGVAIAGVPYDSTSAAPSAATAHQLESQAYCADTSASGTAQSCTTSPSFTPAAGDCVIYTTTTANTGTGLTLNVNSLGAKSVAKWLGTTTLAAGDVPANQAQHACYNGTVWNLSTIGNAPSGSGLPSSSANQTFANISGTPLATSALQVTGTAANSPVAIGQTSDSTQGLEVTDNTQFLGIFPATTPTFTSTCASGTTASCPISSNTGFPAQGIALDYYTGELIKFTGTTSTTITGLTRGYAGTTAAGTSNGDPIHLIIASWGLTATSTTNAVYLLDNGILYMNSQPTNHAYPPGSLVVSTAIQAPNGMQFGGGAMEFGGNGTSIQMQTSGGATVAGFTPTATFGVIGTAIASASTIAPVTPVAHITGTTTINTITPPSGCTTATYGCELKLIPDGLWSTGTSGNIAIATTGVVSKVLILTYDPATSKWYPSY